MNLSSFVKVARLPLHGKQDPPDWKDILTYFRGNELQNYFTRMLEDNLQVRFYTNSLV
jgi:translation initiation factor RLI1